MPFLQKWSFRFSCVSGVYQKESRERREKREERREKRREKQKRREENAKRQNATFF